MQLSCDHLEQQRTPRETILLDPVALRSASALLNQQMWCFGQDIRNPEGNVLLRFGFQRHRQTDKPGSMSAYVLTPYPSAQLVLWGFGLFYGQGAAGGMFLKRYQFNPVWTPHAQLPEMVWEPADLPNLRPAGSPKERRHIRRLLSRALRWITCYEQWIQDTFGTRYRQRCLQQWHQVAVPAETIPAAWQSIAERVADL